MSQVRFNDFCRWIFQRAQSRTARAFQTSETGVGMTAWLVYSCLFPNGSRRSYAGPGAENTDPRHSPPQLLVIATSPQPRSLQTLFVANIELFPALEKCWKKFNAAEGRGTPDFREEIQRSRTRRAFHHFRPFLMERGYSPGRSRLMHLRLFHLWRSVRGTLARNPEARSFDKRADLPFCYR